MLKCEECGEEKILKVCVNCKTIFCDRCQKELKCKICENTKFIRVKKGKLLGEYIDFLEINEINIGLVGFNRLDSNILRIIEEFVKLKNKIKEAFIILFPNKIESIKFVQKFDQNLEYKKSIEKSKYAIITEFRRGNLNFYFLLNTKEIKLSEIGFLVELLSIEKNNLNNLNFLLEKEKYQKLVKKALEIYNKKMNIDFVNFGEEDYKLSEKMAKNCISYYNSYCAYKRLLKKYPLDLLEYLYRKLELNHSLVLHEYLDSPIPNPNINDLFNIFWHISGLKIVELSLKENEKIRNKISKVINKYIKEALDLFNNEEVSSILSEYITEIEKQDFKNYDEYFNFLNNQMLNLFNKIPTIFLRYDELPELYKEALDILRNLEYGILEQRLIGWNTNIILNIREISEYFIKIDKIIKSSAPTQIKLYLLHAKIQIISGIIINTRDITLLPTFMETHNKFKKLLLDNFDKIEEYFPMRKWDLLLNFNLIARVYYTLNEIDKTKEIVCKNRELINKFNPPDSIKIYILFDNFHMFEDYEVLKEIYKICIKFKSSEESPLDIYKENYRDAVCKFSSYFFEKKLNFREIIDLIEVQPIYDFSILKDLFEKKAMLNFMKMIYHLENAYSIDSIIMMVSEIEKALKLAEEEYKINEGRYPHDYYLLKTKSIVDILEENVDEVKNTILELEKYDLKTVQSFKHVLSLWLDTFLNDYKKNIEILSQLKETSDPWCNLVVKIIKERIGRTVYDKSKSELEFIRKLPTLEEQLNRFKEIVERDCIDSFWKSRTKNKLKSRAEDIAHSLLLMFLTALDFYSYIGEEVKKGVGKCDIFLLSKENKRYIVEIKIVKSERDIKKGIKELDYYTQKEKLNEGYLVLFDVRKKQKTRIPINKKILHNGKVFYVTHIRLYDVPPSRI